MTRPDDSSLTPGQHAKVVDQARQTLIAADALGRFPTPVRDIMTAARIEEVEDDVLDENFLASMRRKAGKALKRAVSKVIGLFDAAARLVFLDRTIHEKKQVFVRLHETGHAAMPWQRDIYAVVEECGQTLNPEIADLFDREANVFASEVLFQLGAFNEEAGQHDFGIKVPLKLSKKYGASVYSSMRRYVSGHEKACAVLVFEPPEPVEGDGFQCRLRRVVASDRFRELFGPIEWPDHVTPDDALGAVVPVGRRRMSAPRSIGLRGANDAPHECVVEAFSSGYQVFVLLHSLDTLRPTVVAQPERD